MPHDRHCEDRGTESILPSESEWNGTESGLTDGRSRCADPDLARSKELSRERRCCCCRRCTTTRDIEQPPAGPRAAADKGAAKMPCPKTHQVRGTAKPRRQTLPCAARRSPWAAPAFCELGLEEGAAPCRSPTGSPRQDSVVADQPGGRQRRIAQHGRAWGHSEGHRRRRPWLGSIVGIRTVMLTGDNQGRRGSRGEAAWHRQKSAPRYSPETRPTSSSVARCRWWWPSSATGLERRTGTGCRLGVVYMAGGADGDRDRRHHADARDPRLVADSLDVSRRTYSKIKQARSRPSATTCWASPGGGACSPPSPAQPPGPFSSVSVVANAR